MINVVIISLSFVTFYSDAAKASSPASRGRHSVCKKFSPTKEVQANVSTPLKHNDASKVKVSTASTTGSTLPRSTVGSPGSLSLTNINFKDMVATEADNHKEKYIKAFEGWLDYQSVVQTVKALFPKNRHPSGIP